MSVRKCILVVDDEKSVRRSFELALEDTSCTVITADSGATALQKVKNNRFRAIFLDLKMPGMNGVETLRAIRKINIHLPVYVVTAFHKEFLEGLEQLRQEGLKFQLLRKPIGSAEIQALVQSVLDAPL